MAITYPLTMPTTLSEASEIELRRRAHTKLAESPFTYAQQVFRHPGQYWTASVRVEPASVAAGEAWATFLLSLDGVRGTFLLNDPLARRPRGAVGSSTVLVDGVQASASATLAVKGLPTSTSGVFLAGDYIQLGSGATASLHMVTEDAASDGAGEATLAIWPSLRRATVDEEAVTYENPRGRFRLASNAMGWSQDFTGRYRIAFDAVEAIA